MTKINNPRVFAETISLDVWRTKYSGEASEADLHIDVGFYTGRLGGDALEDCPVRFRLSLRRAEVHVIRDQGKAIRIPPSSLVRAPIVQSHIKTVAESNAGTDAKLNAAVSTDKISGGASLDAHASTNVTKELKREEDIGDMKVTHRALPGQEGYVFQIEPVGQAHLQGSPWEAKDARMKIRDEKSKRKRGDKPEVIVQIRCKREDLHVEDIQLKDASRFTAGFGTRKKKLAVEQYIKAEILKLGFACGDLSEPFSELILGDAVSVED